EHFVPVNGYGRPSVFARVCVHNRRGRRAGHPAQGRDRQDPQLSHGLLPPLERPDTQADRYCLAMIFLYSLYSSQRAARKKGSSSLVAASHSCRATLSVSSHPGTVGAASSGGGVRATAG